MVSRCELPLVMNPAEIFGRGRENDSFRLRIHQFNQVYCRTAGNF